MLTRCSKAGLVATLIDRSIPFHRKCRKSYAVQTPYRTAVVSANSNSNSGCECYRVLQNAIKLTSKDGRKFSRSRAPNFLTSNNDVDDPRRAGEGIFFPHTSLVFNIVMDGTNDIQNPSKVIRLLIPRAPSLIKSALLHSLGLSATSSKWDLRTELIIGFLRRLLAEESTISISKLQQLSLSGPAIKGKMWISKVTLPAPEEDDIRETLIKAIDDLAEGKETYMIPDLAPVEAEWTGNRANVEPERPRLDLSEAQHYEKLMAEVSSDVTILYFHGGAFFLCDPSTHRTTVVELARLCRGRCLSVRYRLAPKYAFPSALLDAFLAYLSLLCPPPNSLHAPVPASQIVFAGDSAGGSIALSLLQLILQIQRSSSSTIRLHDQTISVPLPAGVATISSWVDLTHSMPAYTNALYDFLPSRRDHSAADSFPPCEIWPTEPLRGNIYCDNSMLCHPLVSSLAAQDWQKSCPLWFGYGQEMLVDEGRAVAARAAKQGVSVVWDEWEAMPHCFMQVLQHLPAAQKCKTQWVSFCEQVVRNSGVEGINAAKVQTKGTWYAAKTGKEKPVDLRSFAGLSDDKIMQRMKTARAEKSHEPSWSAKSNVLPKL